MQDQLTQFEREGDAYLLAKQARAEIAREIRRVAVAVWRRLTQHATSGNHAAVARSR